MKSKAELESEAQGALRSSENQKSESEAEPEARRNRSQKDQKSFFSSDSASAYVAFDPVRTRLTESEAQAKLSANQKFITSPFLT